MTHFFYGGLHKFMNNNKKTAFMADRIRSNREDDISFVKMLDNFINGSEKINMPLTIGRTPNALAAAGADSTLMLIISPKTIKKCISNPEDVYHGHDLSIDILKKLPSELRNPVMIFKGNEPNSLAIITSLKDNKGRGIMVAVQLKASIRRCKVNRISSAYGRNNFNNYIENQINCGNLIAANIEKANEMLQSLGLQSPPEETFISFNDSIAYSMESVKGFEEFFMKKEFAKNFERRLDEIDTLKERLCRISINAVRTHPDYICYITDLYKLPEDEKQVAASLLSQREDILCNELIESSRGIEKLESYAPGCITTELVNMYTDFMALENKVELIRQERNILNFGRESLRRKSIKR